MRASLSTLALAPLAALLAACSAPLAPGGAGDSFLHDAAEGASSAALVVFERTVTADDTAHASTVARFIKMRSGAVDEQTLRMVGATLDLPALGTCGGAGATASDGDQAGDGPRAVELLDVGSVAIEAAGTHTTLEARSLPDIVDLVTGVLYSTRATALDALPGRGIYLLHSAGSSGAIDVEHNVAPFDVSATAPGEPSDLRIDGQDARATDGVTLKAGGGVDLAWELGDTSDPDDVVYVELIAGRSASADTATDRPGGPSGPIVANVRCLFADRGVAAIPASAFVVAERELTRGTIVVHRVHRETFQVAAEPASGRTGIDSGVVRFDFARAAEFTRR